MQIMDRLVMDLELFPFQRDAQISFTCEPRMQVGLHIGLKDAI